MSTYANGYYGNCEARIKESTIKGIMPAPQINDLSQKFDLSGLKEAALFAAEEFDQNQYSPWNTSVSLSTNIGTAVIDYNLRKLSGN